jgi:hypothetical protein
VIRTLADDPRRLESAMIYVSITASRWVNTACTCTASRTPSRRNSRRTCHGRVAVKQMTSTGDVDPACLRAKSHAAFSHDNLFHSVLGLMDVQTSAYHASSDIFDGCRGSSAPSLAQTRFANSR